ncbi:hypothetical protein HPULCUR_011769 [Helicostylum pulchrum]|uniref:VPS9 domain-containing protein n=1 Tax=Helicostylum pulchrum TaxID=562976 RepID=A0ABP9YH08_9FUNG
MTHFHSLFCESAIVCIPHSRSIEGLVLTKDIIETHCFQMSPYFCGQYRATKQKQKIIELDDPIISTIEGFKEVRTVHIMDEEVSYKRNNKIRILLIDRLLEGEPPKYHYHKHAITIPPVRNSRTDLEFLNMFPENLEALYELQTAVQEFTDSYTYRTILQRNKLLQDSCRTPSEHDQFLELVENVVMSFLHKKIWIQSLQSLLSSQDNYLDTVCYTYSTVTLSQYSIRYPISEMNLSCFRDAINNFKRLDSDIIDTTTKHSPLAFTPLEKLTVLKTTLDLISLAVSDYVKDFGNGTCDTSVTADELIPLLAFVIVQSNVPRLASLIYYMQYYRLARMVEGSVYSFVVTTMKTACEFLKDDPLSLNDASSVSSSISAGSLSTINLSPERSRSVSFSSTNKFGKPISAPPHHVNSARFSLNHRKSQSADLYGLTDLTISASNSNSSIHPSPLEQEVLDADIEEDHYSTSSATSSNSNSRRNSAIIRPHMVLPNPRTGENRKSLDIPNDWLLPNYTTNNNRYKLIPSRNLGLSKPMVTTTFPSISNSTPLPVDLLPDTDLPPITTSSTHALPSVIDIPKLGRSLSTSTVIKKKLAQPPKVINIRDRISFDGIRRPASICIDTRSLHSIEDGKEDSEELMGDFLRGLSKIDGNVVGERTGSIKTFRHF